MKFTEGDKMVIRRTGEEGHIVSLIGKDMAEVAVGGTVFPIYLDEIDHPYLRWFTGKRKEAQQKKKVLREQIPVEQLIQNQAKAASGVHLVFMPVFCLVEMEEQVERFKIFVQNHTHYTVTVQYNVRVEGNLIFTYSGVLHPFADIYLHHLDWETMQQVPRFEWSLTESVSEQYAPKSEVLKIKAARLFTHITQLQQENLPTFRYTLLTEFDPKPEPPKKFSLPAPMPATSMAVKSVQLLPKYELDLHIEQIISDTRGLTNSDILQLQLAELDRYLNIAAINRQDKMVVIHGNGKGTLRHEVQKRLKNHVFTRSIESGWQAGYGFGATIVYFQY